MEINEVKKALYKQKPIAGIVNKTETNHKYSTQISDDVEIIFDVPIKDMGEKLFDDSLPAQLLIRYISEVVNTQL